MVRLGSVVMQVSDITRAMQFWGQALQAQYELVHSDHNSATFFPRDRAGVALQLTEGNRMHLDLNTDSPEENAAEITRLESLGARRVDWPFRPDVPVMADPDGNLFCVC
jgi:predicted enzyme related to lactoylglutathione lyase